MFKQLSFNSNFKFRISNFQHGQALIMLVTFVAIATSVISSAIVGTLLNATSTTRLQEGEVALDVAESGAENALLRLLRDSSYTGETLSVGSGSTVITISGTNPKTITSTATVGSFKRTIQITATDVSGILTVTSWKEL